MSFSAGERVLGHRIPFDLSVCRRVTGTVTRLSGTMQPNNIAIYYIEWDGGPSCWCSVEELEPLGIVERLAELA